MKKACIFLFFCAALFVLSLAHAADLSKYPLTDIEASVSFPVDYAVVTLETVASHMDRFPFDSVEDAERELILSGVHAIAFSPADDLVLRLIAVDGDEDAKLYHDIERYTSAMRTQIRDYFLDRNNFEGGLRYTEANWTNKTGQGRILQLVYSIREDEEIVARGRQAYTIRGGRAFTLDMQITGRRITDADNGIFDAVLAATSFPRDADMPLLPVGLTLAEPLPEETYRDIISVRGETTRGAAVTAYYQPSEGDAVPIGEALAGNGGIFRLDMQLPRTGDLRVYVLASLNGFEDSQIGAWVHYDPDRLPVSFTSYPEGIVTDTKIVLSGKTIAGVSIQCMEGDTNKKAVTSSDGRFSFTLDKNITGKRRVVLSLNKDGFANRRFTIDFTRQWLMEDLVKQLDQQVQSLSYQNLTENPQRYEGRIVRYSGLIIDVSSADGITYVELASRQDSEGNWDNRVIAFDETGMDIPLAAGNLADLYFEVTPDTFTFPDNASELDGQTIDLPAVRLLGYRIQ